MKEKVDFDDFASDYDQLVKEQLKFFDSDNDYFSEYKIILTKKLLKGKLCRKILDFGCGVGRSIDFFRQHFPAASVYGCDISEESLNVARRKAPDVTFMQTDDLIASDRQFDLIFLAGVLHHVEPEKRKELMTALAKMVVPDGNIVVFEHNPFNPVTRRMVSTCPFDSDAVLLSPREMRQLFTGAGILPVRSDYTLFFPARLKWLRVLEPYMRGVPLGGQYVVLGEMRCPAPHSVVPREGAGSSKSTHSQDCC